MIFENLKIQSIFRIILIHNQKWELLLKKYMHLFLFIRITDELQYHNSVNANRSVEAKGVDVTII